MTKKQYETYNPKVDKEHEALLGGRVPSTRDEQIQFAHKLANVSGKRVRINAYTVVPDAPPEPTDWVAAAGYLIGGAFVLILVVGLVVAVAAAVTGNLPAGL